ncbi:MAG TPA: twin-arginine translocase TatA/TatE family subunit [Candidatus Sulfotelmatobacter sp.]|jgi:sec-independent protein translocase protein TatA|nr:twin-arginine translocase TatA/TatE family subunit [Candidatus Sulfotelmatobacter sp.]
MFEGLFQPMHLVVIFFIALLVFGPKKLPELGKGLGEGIRALKEGMKDNTSAQTPTDSSKKTEPKA